jgi:hypothetical protein
MKLAPLTAGVSFINGGKASHVTIRSGNLIVATARIGGKWEPAKAVVEFRRNSHRFQLAPKFKSLSADAIKSLA